MQETVKFHLLTKPIIAIKRAPSWFWLALPSVAGGILMYFLGKYSNNFGVDWHESFYPATSMLLHGANPYQMPGIFSPVWALAMLVPFTLFGEGIGGILLYCFNLFTLVYVLYRFHVKPTVIILVLFSPMAYVYLHHGNIDSFVLWGFLLPPPLALFLLAIKPQTGMAVAVYMAYTIWRADGWKKLLVTFLPVAVALAANILLSGAWASSRTSSIVTAVFNKSLFPWSVPIGVAFIVFAVRKQKIELSIAASPFLSPYVQASSWIVALFAVTSNFYLMFGAVVLSWLAFVLIH